jgi:hypothetical protein
MTLSDLNQLASEKRDVASAAEEALVALRQLNATLSVELSESVAVLDAAKERVRLAAEALEAARRSGSDKRQADSDVRSTSQAVRAVKAAHDALAKRVADSNAAIATTLANADAARSTAAAAATLAERITKGDEFEQTTFEDDRARGIYAAPCFRYQRRACPTYRQGIPKICECCKDYPTFTGFTPGLLVVACPHGHIYFLKLLRKGESPEVVFEFLRDRCRPPTASFRGTLPFRICYDNGCHLHSYIAARCPELSAVIQVIIDRLHASNHVHCSTAYQLDRFTQYNKSLNFNTQVVEQLNRLLQRMAPHLRFSTPANIILALCIFMVISSSLRMQRHGVVAGGSPSTASDEEDDGSVVDDDAEAALAAVM